MPPSLLSINNYYYRRGGAEVVFLEQNRLFEEIGWTVVPFSMRHAKNLSSPWQENFVDEIEFGEQYSRTRKVVNASKVIYSAEARHKIGDLALRVKPSVAHAHNVYHHISPAIFSKLKALKVPTVLTLHDLKLVCPAYSMLTHDGICERCKGGAIWNVVRHRCMKGSLALSLLVLLETSVHRMLGSYSRYVDRFVVPSRFYLEKFVEWGWPRERFAYIPNFADVGRLRPVGSPGKTFLYFGRLSKEKGIATFIRALALAGAKGCIVGAGPDEARLRQLGARSGATVEFLGFRSGESLLDAIRAARAVVLPSESYENAPMSVLEAYALERPVIGASIGGIPELIREGETGAAYPSGDAEALANRLREFSSKQDDEIVGMGKAGRRWVEAEFTADCYRARLLELYGSIGVAF
jgi:glycosyltransferase involved in cell wall biosynthesis